MVQDLLAARGAGAVDHPGGTLLAHLARTRDTLAAWGARPALCTAGLAHAAYGTDGFALALVDLAERPLLVEEIGAEAEGIVYAYAALDRGFTYPLLIAGERRWRDRFTGEVTEPPPELLRDVVELTFANELDVLAHDDDLRTRHGPGLTRLFTACRPHVSVAAHAEFERQLR